MASATKQALLAALSAAQGECISGQQLAQQLGVSRAAVHKAAAALAAQGYALEAAPRRGYRLAGGDPFCAEAVGEYNAPIYLYDKLESSNRTAKTLALEGTPHGTMVLTSQQTAGRGRLGRRFESPAGKGIYLSLVLRPGLPMTEAQAVTVSAAVAVCRAVKRLCGLDLGIKWVNDLYYNGKKVCGILTEAGADIESGQLEWLVVGIGLNLTSRPEDWPEELRPIAGSLYPRRACTGEPGGTGRGHRPGTAGSLPGLRLSGRVPRPVLCAGPLGHGLHRDGELRRKGGGHRRRRATHRAAGRGPHRGALPRRSEYKAVAAGGKIIRII